MNPSLESALLYTFSTIPQTLGAALGVIAAFVLFRFQTDSASLWDDAKSLISQYGPGTRVADSPPTTLLDLLSAGKYRRLIAALTHIWGGESVGVGGQSAPPQNPSSERGVAYSRLMASLAARDRIRDALVRAFAVTALVITGSVVVLTVEHPLSCQPWYVPSAFLAVGVAGLGASLWQCWNVIQASLWTE